MIGITKTSKKNSPGLKEIVNSRKNMNNRILNKNH
jgi:hypothetical protein